MRTKTKVEFADEIIEHMHAEMDGANVMQGRLRMVPAEVVARVRLHWSLHGPERRHAVKQFACWAWSLPAFAHDRDAQLEIAIELGDLSRACCSSEYFLNAAVAALQARGALLLEA